MKTFDVKRSIAVALVACLPIACGSSVPTGSDVIALDPGAAVSALRIAPLPPTAPEAPSPETVPVPEPAPSVPTDDTSVSAPDVNTGRRPGPRPSDVPPSTDPPEDGVVVPPPPPPPGNDTNRMCLAAAAEIMILRGSLPLPLYQESVLLELAMLDKDGAPVKDGSCQGVVWTFDDARYAAAATIAVGADTRYATVSGLAGAYVIRATTPNGYVATVAIRLQ